MGQRLLRRARPRAGDQRSVRPDRPRHRLIRRVVGRAPAVVVAALSVAALSVATLGTAAAGTVPAWGIQDSSNPTGAQQSELTDVACTSATACTAVGYYKNNSGVDVTLAERWNGATWTVQSPLNPTGAQASSLAGVSCQSATSCMAAGDYENSSGIDETLLEVWNGTSWVSQPTPNPGGEQSSLLTGVSARPGTAVGSYINSSGVSVTLAERWNGHSWVVQTTPNPTGSLFSQLTGVSCTNAGAQCTAVGYYFNTSETEETVTEHWNSKSWTLEKSVNPAGPYSVLHGVSCSTSKACTAVGYTVGDSSSNVLSLAERWNGTKWSLQTTSNPANSPATELQGVSCPSAKVCLAVGWSQNSSNVDVPVAEQWNGTTWTLQTIPSPSGSLGSYLEGVSCPTVTACDATGFYNTSGTYETLAEGY